jgi:uncharacterized protein with ParB-like and HNH nuclease domain/predicted transport protein
MKASEKPFLKFLQGTNQFIVPIYQRTYSWTTEECAQFWDDIVRTAKSTSSTAAHFVGSIVYIESDLYQVGIVPRLLVIDGQQRLATLSLLIAALARTIKTNGDSGEMTHKKLVNYYLFNGEETDNSRYKLILTQGDRATLTALVDEHDLPDEPARRLARNFEFFAGKIAASGLSADDIFEGLTRLMIVDIALDRTHDNPQLIFESLNSTGLELTQADLVRNYVLMGLEPDAQEQLYTAHWFPMEKSFGDEAYALYFDRFMRDYLTLKTGSIPNIDRIYTAFKEYARGWDGTVEELVADVHRYSRYFVAMALEQESDRSLRAAIRDINTLRVDVAYPFLLHLYEWMSQGVLDKAAVVQALRLIESYVFRRVICGIPTNTLNRTFAGLAAQLSTSDPLESLQAAFLLKDSYRRFPEDEEFTREFVAKDVYNLRTRNYLLRKLENHRRKESVDVESFTIEHVLPQNPELSATWQAELGPDWQQIQGRFLHTIGNLTLTGYNSELSDKAFLEKRDMLGGFKDSPIRLNRSLATLEHWNEAEILKRAKTLARTAVDVWGAPSLDPAVVDLYRPSPAGTAYSLDAHPHLIGTVRDLFEELRKRILNIDSSVTEHVLKLYVAYKTQTNFVDVVPQKGQLKLSLGLAIDQLQDPMGWGRDVSAVGHWGNGEVEVTVSQVADLDYAMKLIHQAYELQSDVPES